MKYFINTIICLFIVIGSVLLLWVADGYSFYEEIQTGARPLGMGGAFSAISNDGNAIFYNPAGLGQLVYPEVFTMYSKMYQGLDYGNIYSGFVGGAIPIVEVGTIGGGFHTRRTASYGKSLSQENLFMLSFGRELGKVGFGTSLKVYNYKWSNLTSEETTYLGGTNKTAFDADIGFLWRPGKLAVGAVVTNVAQADLGLNEANRIPIGMRGGISLNFSSVILAGEVIAEQRAGKTSIQGKGGAEVRIKDVLSLRAGGGAGDSDYQNISAGVGLRLYQGLGIDYAFNMPMGTIKDITGNHKISLRYQFRPFEHREDDEDDGNLEDWVERDVGLYNEATSVFEGDEQTVKNRLTERTSASSTYLSPNDDGNNDTITFRHSFTDEELANCVRWRIRLRKAHSTSWITIKEGDGKLPDEIDWDGTTPDGDRLKEGRYYYIIELFDIDYNIIASEERLLIIDFTPPIVLVFAEPTTIMPTASPDADIPRIIYFTTAAEDTLSGVMEWSLTISDSEDIYREFTGDDMPPETIQWDGRDDLQELNVGGKFTYMLTATDNAGNKTESGIGEVLVFTYLTPFEDIETLRELNIPIESIYFASGERTLSTESQKTLDKITAELQTNPDYYVIIRGHTDAKGSALTNWQISDERTAAVTNYLLKNGAKKKQIYDRGMGEVVPVAPNETEAGRAQNRRADIILIPIVIEQ